MRYVIYHAGCNDGFAAAWVAWCRFSSWGTIYVPMQYGDKVPDFLPDDEVYVLDFSFPVEDMLRLQDTLAYFIVMDHHKTVMDNIEDPTQLHCLFYDETKSGCRMAWEYFYPKSVCPDLLRYIEDRDLWNWDLAHTKEAHLLLSTIKMNFENFNSMVDNFQADPRQYLTIGTCLGAYEDNMVKRIVSSAKETNFLGRGTVVPVVNTPVLQSEVGHALCKNYPYAVMWYDDGSKRIYSLRSAGEFDVGELARSMGGGGHKNASGFVRKVKDD